jgi:hypothetical protein
LIIVVLVLAVFGTLFIRFLKRIEQTTPEDDEKGH